MIDLYTWPTPNGRKVSIALEEFALPYQVHAVDLQRDEQFAEAFLAISPNNKIPAIVDQDTGRSLMESGAILIYLADKCDQFWGADRFDTLQWLMLQMASIGPMLGQVHYFAKYNSGKAPFAEQRFRNEALRLYGVLNKRLAEQEFLAGTIPLQTWQPGRGFRVFSGSRLTWQNFHMCDAGTSRSRRVKRCRRATTSLSTSMTFRCPKG